MHTPPPVPHNNLAKFMVHRHQESKMVRILTQEFDNNRNLLFFLKTGFYFENLKNSLIIFLVIFLELSLLKKLNLNPSATITLGIGAIFSLYNFLPLINYTIPEKISLNDEKFIDFRNYFIFWADFIVFHAKSTFKSFSKLNIFSRFLVIFFVFSTFSAIFSVFPFSHIFIFMQISCFFVPIFYRFLKNSGFLMNFDKKFDQKIHEKLHKIGTAE